MACTKSKKVISFEERLAAKKKKKSAKNWALGKWEQYLTPFVEPYANALARGWTTERDFLGPVLRGYHANFSWRLEDHDEPEGELIPYDDNNPPPTEKLDETEEACKRKKIQSMNKVFVNTRIECVVW